MKRTDSYSVIKDVQTWSGRITFHYQGKLVSAADRKLLIFAFTGQCALIMDLLPQNVDAFRSYSTFLRTNDRIDIVEFGSFLKSVDGVVKNYLASFEKGEKWTYMRFKRACGSAKAFWSFIGPIRKEIESYLAFPTVSMFRILSQYLNFISRANMKSLDFKSKMEQEYLLLEEEMGGWTYPADLISELSRVISAWLAPFSCSDMVPKHGPGSIAEVVGRPCTAEKYFSLSIDEALIAWSRDVSGISTLFPTVQDPFNAPLQRISSLVCVPKSLTTNRTISKEPCSLQYLQQGVMAELVRCLERPGPGEHISFAHQELSQEMAREGSDYGKYATIDLSSASDTVTVQLVDLIVKNPLVQRALHAVRSTATVLPSGRILQLHKFAPMGSSVCFPIETMVFAACCEVAVRREGGRRREYRVYGDDIVISSECTDDLLEILKQMHFQVNSSKSFYTSRTFNFREACGGEYFNTNEVTPLRIPRRFKCVSQLRWSDADIVDAYVSFANRAFDFGYMTLRRLILDELNRLMISLGESLQSLPFSEDGRIGIKTYSDSCTNFGSHRRWNSRIFSTEHRVILSHSVPKKVSIQEALSLLEEFELFEWLRRHPIFDERVVGYDLTRDSDVDVLPSSSKLRYKWTQI